jgi:hypothetical protein
MLLSRAEREIAMKRSYFAVWVVAATGWGSLGVAADGKQACLDAASQGQILRNARQLLQARQQFLACGLASCPGVVQKDCVAWLDQVEKDIPSIALQPRDAAGNDLVDIKVTIDGVVVGSGKLDGGSIEVNPGPHTIRFELADGTSADAKALVTEGDKNHVVTAVLGKLSAPPGPAGGANSAAPPGSSGPWRTVGLITAGVGVATIAVGGVFGLLAIAKQKDADCPNNVCVNVNHLDQLHSATSAANVSTALFVTGGLLSGAGIALWVLAPRARDAESGPLRLTPWIGAGTMALRGSW